VIVGLVASLTVAAWAYLALARGDFWRTRERDANTRAPASWPPVTAIVPARDEAESIARSIGSLIDQDYPGEFAIILVDDESRDGTAALARSASASRGKADRLTILPGTPLQAGWTGKLWAQNQGVTQTAQSNPAPRYLLLTDADIVHAPDSLRTLVSEAEAGGLVLTSRMAMLRCESAAERLLIPAFIFFFQMLYPFAWANDRKRTTAAAAGGCMLVRRDALEQAGGLSAIRDALIDDCALARLMKRIGPIRIALTQRVTSIRPYPTTADVGRMISRSAYAQLNYSAVLLAGTIAGLTLIYLAPVLLAMFSDGLTRIAGLACWFAMAFLYQPTLRFYQLPPWYGLLLPTIAAIYMWFTCASALAYARGRGGMWKGRAQAPVNRP
jgi:hopene-associated glycosyltransferase HpnB